MAEQTLTLSYGPTPKTLANATGPPRLVPQAESPLIARGLFAVINRVI